MEQWKSSFKQADTEKITDNPFKLIGKDWFLLTAGTKESFNTMTASWGTVGVFWHKPIAICFIRPTRHTFNFIEEADSFTMSFLEDGNKDILNFCGSKSGREFDKVKETGLVPVELESKSIGFQQSKLILECKKIYMDDLKPVFFLPDDADDKYYPAKDYHRMYFGEITACYINPNNSGI